MQAITISQQGRPVADNIMLDEDWPDPAPERGEVLVRTEASAFNHLDLWVGRGLPGLNLAFPRISGSDGVGIVEAVGEGVDADWVGRRVALNAAIPKHDPVHPDVSPALPDNFMIGEHTDGTMAAMFKAPVANVIDIGDVDPVEAACFALSGLTAWRMLHTRARIQPGQWVLIPGIGGGVALTALAIARHLGCHTIVTSRYQHKLDQAHKLGADVTILDNGQDWSRDARAATGKRGVDVCCDSVGKAIHLSCIKSLARGGVFVTCGCTTGPDATTDLARIFWNQLTVIGSTMGNMDEFRQIMSMFTAGSLRPVIDSVHPPSDAAKAYARLESGEQFGKVAIRWTSTAGNAPI